MIKIRTLYIVLPLTILMAVGCYLKGWTAGIALWALLALVCVGRILREWKEKNGAEDAQKKESRTVCEKRESFRRKLSLFAVVSSVSMPRFVRSAACILRRSPYNDDILLRREEGLMEQRRARGMLAAAAVIFGTLAPFVRGISVSSGELALYRAVMAALLVGGYLLVSGQKLALRANRREAALLLLSGMAMGVNWILLFEAYRYTTVSVATLSYYFAPVLVTAACPLLFHERLTGKQIVCFVMSTLGLVLVIGVGGLRGVADVRGVLFGLGAAAFYAAVILLNKFIRSVAGIQRTFLQFLAAIVILIPYVAATGGVSLGTLDARGWVCLLIVGFFHTGVTYCLYFSALRELPGQEVALLSYMDPLVAVIVSVTVLGEPVTAPQLVGGALILGFTLWNELPEKK